jgi:hypothetical protein
LQAFRAHFCRLVFFARKKNIKENSEKMAWRYIPRKRRAHQAPKGIHPHHIVLPRRPPALLSVSLSTAPKWPRPLLIHPSRVKTRRGRTLRTLLPPRPPPPLPPLVSPLPFTLYPSLTWSISAAFLFNTPPRARSGSPREVGALPWVTD